MPFCISNKYKGGADIRYDMIIGHYLMVHLILIDNFKRKDLECDKNVVPMKDPGNLLGKYNRTKYKMQ